MCKYRDIFWTESVIVGDPKSARTRWLTVLVRMDKRIRRQLALRILFYIVFSIIAAELNQIMHEEKL